MNISNVNFERDGSSAHNIAPEALAPETLAQENGHADALKALPMMSTSILETAVCGSSAEPEQAVSEGAPFLQKLIYDITISETFRASIFPTSRVVSMAAVKCRV